MSSNLKAVVVIVVLLGVIGLASYRAAKQSKPSEEGRTHTAILMCADPACNKISAGRIVAGQPPPYTCKYCGKKTAYRAVRCENCDTIFPYIVRHGSTPAEEFVTTECPECRYDRFRLIQSMKEAKELEAKRE